MRKQAKPNSMRLIESLNNYQVKQGGNSVDINKKKAKIEDRKNRR
tara:strand:- start:3326 stop:3460 length:135 start_codon:yes stop_codon:yes gene_type:complete